MINNDRLVSEFIELIKIDGPSKKEGVVAAAVAGKLMDLGFEVWNDNTGNILSTKAGKSYGVPVLFCAHLDTVESTEAVAPTIDGGVIRSGGKSILGADDRAGIAVFLEAMRSLAEDGVSHGIIEAVFTVGEEVGLLGAKSVDWSRFNSKIAFVLDSGDRVGSAVVRAPTEIDFWLTVTGKPAHAGVEPEKGVNAIVVAANAIARAPSGRIDPDTTANFGTISGGKTTNIVPDRVEIAGEIRSMDEGRVRETLDAILRAFEDAAKAAGAGLEVTTDQAYQGFVVDSASPVVRLFERAARQVGLEPAFVSRGGGSDTNIVNARGMSAVNIGIGAKNEHTRDEHIAIWDLVKAAELVAALVAEAGI